MEQVNTLRIPVDLEVAWKIDKKIGQPYQLEIKNVCRTKAFDISCGGMGIISKYFLPYGLRISIAFSAKILGLNKFFRLKGEVRYCNYIKPSNYKCGVKFINPPLLYSKKFSEFKSIFEKRKEPRVTLSD